MMSVAERVSLREWSELEGAPPAGGEAHSARFSILEGAHILAFVSPSAS